MASQVAALRPVGRPRRTQHPQESQEAALRECVHLLGGPAGPALPRFDGVKLATLSPKDLLAMAERIDEAASTLESAVDRLRIVHAWAFAAEDGVTWRSAARIILGYFVQHRDEGGAATKVGMWFYEHPEAKERLRPLLFNPPRGRLLCDRGAVAGALQALSERALSEREPWLADVLSPRFLALLAISTGLEKPVAMGGGAPGLDAWRLRLDAWRKALERATREKR